jgi:hypothetical protein
MPGLTRTALVVAAFIAPLLAGPAAHGAELQCGAGFTMTSQTDGKITCLRSINVRSAAAADNLMKRWAQRVVCSGQVQDAKSSMGEAEGGTWQVVVRFICAGE